MRMFGAAVLFLSAAPIFSPAASAEVSVVGSSTTYLQSREDTEKRNILGAYEYLNFSVLNPEKESFTFHMGGWLRYNLGSMEPDAPHSRLGTREDNDLSYGYLSYRSSKGNAVVNLGRVLVSEGVAAERVDGIYGRTDLAGNFGVSAFAGRSVDSDVANFSGDVSDTIYGGRLSHQMPGLYRIGISALKEEKDSADFRKEEGVDLWVRPINKVELMGNSKYNSITNDWANHTYFLVLGPFAKVRLNTEASMINYKDYFTGSLTSVFKFDPTVIDEKEKVNILGEEVSYDITDKLNVSVNYKAFRYSVAGDANYYGGNVRFSYSEAGGSGVSIHRMDGKEDRLKYSEYRVYCTRKFGHAGVTLDVLDVAYDTAINDVKDAYSVTLAADYELAENLKLGADVEYSKNPDFDQDIRTFLKLIYSFEITGKRKEGV